MSARQDASRLLSEVEAVRRRALSRLPGMWFPMLLFGGLSLLAAAVAAAFGVGPYDAFWMIAGPAGSLLTVLFYARSGRRIGYQVPAGPYLVAILVILGGASVTGAVGGMLDRPMVSVAGPALAVAAGLLLLARAGRAVPLAALGLGLAALTLATVAAGVDPRAAAVVVSLGYGVPALLLGRHDLRRERR